MVFKFCTLYIWLSDNIKLFTYSICMQYTEIVRKLWSINKMTIFAWNVSLVSLKRSLVFPILLFSSISLHWSLRKAFLYLHGILWNSVFKWVYLSFSPLLFSSLLFTAICKASSDSHFAFLYFFFLGMVLIPVSCTTSGICP